MKFQHARLICGPHDVRVPQLAQDVHLRDQLVLLLLRHAPVRDLLPDQELPVRAADLAHAAEGPLRTTQHRFAAFSEGFRGNILGAGNFFSLGLADWNGEFF